MTKTLILSGQKYFGLQPLNWLYNKLDIFVLLVTVQLATAIAKFYMYIVDPPSMLSGSVK